MEGELNGQQTLRLFARKIILESTILVLSSFAGVLIIGTIYLARQSFTSTSFAQSQVLVEGLRQDFLLGSYASLSQKCRNASEFDGIVAIKVFNKAGESLCAIGDLQQSDFLSRNILYYDEDKTSEAGRVEIAFKDRFMSRFVMLAIAAILIGGLAVMFIFLRFSSAFRRRILIPLDEIKSILTPNSEILNVDTFNQKAHLAEISLIQQAIFQFRAASKTHEALKVSAARDAAIANTTQALAHDVRRPFSMLKNIIQIVEGTADPTEVREVLNQTLPEVNQAMASVEGMIEDVMQIGSEAKLVQEEISPTALLATAVIDILRVHPQADVSIAYKLFHTHQLNVDTARVSRVFANILGNAIQAMREKGEIWIHTAEQGGFVEFVIGNAGSMIPIENLSRLFDAFFTAGKKGGTGLGLAIAKKIVEAHGGKISCRSEASSEHPKGMVEFVFTLPIADALDDAAKPKLPTSSHEVQENLARLRMVAAPVGQTDAREHELEREVERRLSTSGHSQRKFNLLVVDDESVYRDGIRALLGRFASLKKHVDLHMATDANGAMELARQVVPDLIVEDVDLGPSSANGIEVVRAMRAEGFIGHICIHSNRFLMEDSKAAIEAGANAVLPKPLSPAHFLKLLIAALPEAPEPVDVTPTASGKRLSIAVVDDSLSQRLAWKMELEDEAQVAVFPGTPEFFAAVEKSNAFDVIVTDFNFLAHDPHDGASFAKELRSRGFQGLILLSSGETHLESEIASLFDGNVGKSAMEWPQFAEAMDAARLRSAR